MVNACRWSYNRSIHAGVHFKVKQKVEWVLCLRYFNKLKYRKLIQISARLDLAMGNHLLSLPVAW